MSSETNETQEVDRQHEYARKIASVVDALDIPYGQMWSWQNFEDLKNKLAENPDEEHTLEGQIDYALKTYAYRDGISFMGVALHIEDPFLAIQQEDVDPYFKEQAYALGRFHYFRMKNDAIGHGYLSEDVPEATFL
jgi:hypothetical protein